MKPHPAKYSDPLIPVLAKHSYGIVLDIMGGTGKAGLLKKHNPSITKIIINEIEEEWATQAVNYGVDQIIIGDAKKLKEQVDCIVTSPPYGNRMADHFNAGAKGGKSPSSMKHRYAGDLGRNPSEGSVACLHFDKGYQEAITTIYDEVIKNCCFSRFILNVSDFIRNFETVNVTGFFEDYFQKRNFKMAEKIPVETRRQRGVGKNANLRVSHEVVFVFDRPQGDMEALGHWTNQNKSGDKK